MWPIFDGNPGYAEPGRRQWSISKSQPWLGRRHPTEVYLALIMWKDSNWEGFGMGCGKNLKQSSVLGISKKSVCLMMEIRVIDTGKVMAVEVSKILFYHREKVQIMSKMDASKNRDILFRNVKVTTRKTFNYFINLKKLVLGKSCSRGLEQGNLVLLLLWSLLLYSLIFITKYI